MGFLSTIIETAKKVDHAVATGITSVFQSSMLSNVFRFLTIASAARVVTSMGNPNIGQTVDMTSGGDLYLQANETNNVTIPYYFTAQSSTANIINRLVISVPNCAQATICDETDYCLNSTNPDNQFKIGSDEPKKFTVTPMITTDCYSPPTVYVENDGCDYHQPECQQGVNDDVIVTSAYTY